MPVETVKIILDEIRTLPTTSSGYAGVIVQIPILLLGVIVIAVDEE